MGQTNLERVAEIERLKDIIGWSWQQVAKRLGWAPVNLTQFKMGKTSMDERWYRYIEAVAEAVASIPVPSETEPAPIRGIDSLAATAEAGASPLEHKMRAAGFHPSAETEGTEVRVMLLDDVARKIADQYMVAKESTEMNQDERTGALWAIGMLAKTLGVAEEVTRLVRGTAAPAPAARPLVDPRPIAPWSPPQPQPMREAREAREPF